MRLISFDLARAAGIAYWKDGELDNLERIELPDVWLGAMLRHWDNYLAKRLMHGQVDAIAYEDVRPVSKPHGQIQYGMSGVLMMHAHGLNVPCLPVNQMTAKKRLTGKGNAKKPDMIAAAIALYPGVAKDIDDNQADAIAVGLVALDQFQISGTTATK